MTLQDKIIKIAMITFVAAIVLSVVASLIAKFVLHING